MISGIKVVQLKMMSSGEVTIHEGHEKERKAQDTRKRHKEKSRDTVSNMNTKLARLELAFRDKFNQVGELGKHTEKLESNQKELREETQGTLNVIIESCMNQGN